MPVTIGLVSAGVQGLAGLYQSATSGRQEKENELNAFAKQNPLAQRSKSIDEYYQNALNRYNENPYQSLQYQIGQKNIQRATAQGLSALQDRRSAIGGVSRLALGQESGLQNLGAQAESQRNARFGQYGQAAQLQNQQDKYLFDVNKLTPYNRQFGLKQYGAEAANQRYNAGLQMMGSALGNAAQIGAMSAYNKTPKTLQETASTSTVANVNPYSQLAVNPNEFGTNFIDYSTSQSANPSAFGTSYMDFNKYRNPFRAPKGYKGY